MHPLNIPDLAFLMKKLKEHDPKLEDEVDIKCDDALFKLLMNSSFTGQTEAKIYDFEKFKNKKRGSKSLPLFDFFLYFLIKFFKLIVIFLLDSINNCYC